MRRFALILAVVMAMGVGVAAAQSPIPIPLSGGVLLQKFTPSLTPAAIAATTCGAGQINVGIFCSTTETYTVTGLHTSDTVLRTSPPTFTASWPGASWCPVLGAEVSANNALRIRFAVLTTAACTPTAGTYTIYTIRVNP